MYRFILAAAALAAGPLCAADLPQSQDHPLLGRVGGTEIVGYDIKRFDSVACQTSTFKD